MSIFFAAVLAVTILSLLYYFFWQRGPFQPYRGRYKGIYNGVDEGQWKFRINRKGELRGEALSDDLPGIHRKFEGSINEDGLVSAELPCEQSSVNIDGMIEQQKARGNWDISKQTVNGHWSGQKRRWFQ